MIEGIIDQLKLQRNRDSTRRNYHSIWKLFNEFFIKLDKKPTLWEDRLNLFVGYLIEMGRRPSTVKSYISAIKAVLWENQIPLSQDQSLLSALTRACRYHCDGVTLRMPLRRDMVNQLLGKIEQMFMHKGQPYLATLYLAMFSTYYYGLFRIGELASGPHTILA